MTAINIAGKFEAPTAAQLAAAETWVARFAEIWAHPDPEALRPLMHEDTRNLIPPMTEPGDRETVVAYFKGALAQLPDFHMEIIRWAVTGDAIMMEWEGHATVAGKPLSWRGVDRVCLRDGKTYDGQVYWDPRRVAEMVAEAIGAAG